MRGHRLRRIWVAAAALAASAGPAVAGELSGSRASMVRQHSAAVELDYSFLRTPAQVKALIDSGNLERVSPNADLMLSDVSFPFARPDVRRFLERLAAEYRTSNGARLVVTSLTRPSSLQPRNASALSVHPAGMAVDLRVPVDREARAWLERSLLSLEDARVVDVTREHTPPHYHVAVFPEAYRKYEAAIASADSATAATQAEAATPATVSPSEDDRYVKPAIATGRDSGRVIGATLVATAIGLISWFGARSVAATPAELRANAEWRRRFRPRV